MSVPSQAYDDSGSLRLITHEDGEPLECWTLVPERSGSDEHSTTTWMSVDPSTVVDLEEHR